MKPLEHITIVELSTMVTASLATMMLAEQGARVIKVEPVDTGDPMRRFGTAKGGMSGLFASCNRGKESLRIDLKHARGRALVSALALRADVLIHNFRPGVMDALELGSQRLRVANPRLVYVAISGFGTEGPLRNAPAYDPIVQAHAGAASVQGGTTPAFMRTLLCDKLTAYTACQATTAALFARERSGAGQHIDLSMLDASLFFLFPDGYMNHTLLDTDAEQQPLLADLIYEMTTTRDGAIAISASTPRQRLGLARAAGLDRLVTDTRFATPAALTANIAEYRALLAQSFAGITTRDALARLRENDVPCARCLTRNEVIDDPQVRAAGVFEVIDHPHTGRTRIMRSPAKFAGERLPAARPSPAHGEHTDALLRELGTDAREIARLRAEGAVR